jgi:hypothetical protein
MKPALLYSDGQTAASGSKRALEILSAQLWWFQIQNTFNPNYTVEPLITDTLINEHLQ